MPKKKIKIFDFQNIKTLIRLYKKKKNQIKFETETKQECREKQSTKTAIILRTVNFYLMTLSSMGCVNQGKGP